MFEGFESSLIRAGDIDIFIRRSGSGFPLLLLHGFPQTHVMWHRVAPALAAEFTVVCADLRGYGASGRPDSRPDHEPYSKSVMALDMILTMQKLGYERFCLAGHDRGGRVAYRLAMEHPQCVDRLAVLDVIPTSEAFNRADSRLALAFWPWSLLAQPEPLPERLIGADPEAVIDNALRDWGSDSNSFPPEVRAAYIKALRKPGSIHAICEEYRAAATVDLSRDNEDQRAGRRIRCPVLVVWSESGPLDQWYSAAGGPLGIWKNWADNVRGRAIRGGHFFPEENPAETIAELRRFFTSA